jgi:exopolysaccharide production protein ExoQ
MSAKHAARIADRKEEQTEHRGEQWFLVFVIVFANSLVHVANSAIGAGSAGSDDQDSGSALAQIVWGLIYAGGFVGLFVERRRAWSLVRKSWPLALLVTLVGLSTLWSSDPDLTGKRAFGLLGTTAFAYYATCRFSLWTFVKILGISATIAAALSLLLVVVVPSLGIMHGEEYPGAWQGIYGHKNTLGESMSIGIVTLLAIALETTRRRRLLTIGAIALCSLLLLGSQSATAYVSTIVGAVTLALTSLWRSSRHAGLARMAMAIVALSVTVLALYPQALVQALGRDVSLTGRSDIWPVAIEAIANHPFLGYGYSIFWLPNGPYVDYIAATNWDFWRPAHAHNGFLELSLDVGLVGTALFVLILLYAIWRAMRYAVTAPQMSSAWPLAAIASFIVANTTDVSIAAYNSPYWVIFVAAFLYTLPDSPRARAPKRMGSGRRYG